VPPAGDLEIAPRLALEEVGDAAIEMRRLTGDAQEACRRDRRSRSHRAALAAPVHDAMADAAQRHLDAVRDAPPPATA